ncbi:MAG: hypothetical protein HGA69_00555 [Desulfobulbaceae bacterium]|nr:hypothetical protein [Desulfobulbaceae bacterium]
MVTYPKRFELRDRKADLDFLDKALAVADRIGSPTLRRELERQVARVVLERYDVLEVVEGELMGGGGGERIKTAKDLRVKEVRDFGVIKCPPAQKID